MAKQWNQLERLDHKALKKLQVEREKQALTQKASAEKKRIAIIAGAVVFCLICAIAFFVVIRNRSARNKFNEERAELYKSIVVEATGKTLARSLGDWEKVAKGFVFTEDYSFKNEKDGFLVVELQWKNLLKLHKNSELLVQRPTLDEKENKVNKENASLVKGEVTVSVALDGRDLLEVEAGGVVALGASGLYKVLFDNAKGTGEIVVKNGLVEVYGKSNPNKRVKVSGFYKVIFKNGQISGPPTQASVIQYDWR
ncbi:FecR domain-containing protein [bacterium]|nr:FecR domain-containing protein [bacterium]